MARFAFGGVGEANKGELTFVTLPELEAEASADVCVCEFTGGASANETMVGEIGRASCRERVFSAV